MQPDRSVRRTALVQPPEPGFAKPGRRRRILLHCHDASRQRPSVKRTIGV
jgi:hypothetical protein